MKLVLFLLTCLFLVLNACSTKKRSSVMNEKWILQTDEGSRVELEFLPDKTFSSSGKYSNKWYSNAAGTYIYQPETNEIFVTVSTGSLDWLMKPATEDYPEEYWGEVYSDYQLYFKITDMDKSEITVMEYINSYHEDIPESSSAYNKEPVWKDDNGKYTLINNDHEKIKEYKYKVVKN